MGNGVEHVSFASFLASGAKLHARGTLSRKDARLVRLTLFVADVAASRGVADLEKRIGDAADFIASRLPSEGMPPATTRKPKLG